MVEFVLSPILLLIVLLLLLVLIAAALAPLESLGWWAGWNGKVIHEGVDIDVDGDGIPDPPSDIPSARRYLVFMTGVGAIDPRDSLAPDEMKFLDRIRELLPDTELITDIYPYSPENTPLSGRKRRTHQIYENLFTLGRMHPGSLLPVLFINLRNILQVMVSSDPRYGPFYSQGVSREIIRGLVNRGYVPQSGQPVYIIGYSGAAQVAVGCAPFIRGILGAPVYLVSIGGLLTDDPAVQAVEYLTHLYGEKDKVQVAAGVMWPGRWPFMLRSPWVRMVGKLRIAMLSLGPVGHTAKGSYFDPTTILPNGLSCLETTARATARAIERSAILAEWSSDWLVSGRPS